MKTQGRFIQCINQCTCIQKIMPIIYVIKHLKNFICQQDFGEMWQMYECWAMMSSKPNDRVTKGKKYLQKEDSQSPESYKWELATKTSSGEYCTNTTFRDRPKK